MRIPEGPGSTTDWSKEAMAMLMRTDPFRELDRLTQQVFGGQLGTWSRPAVMPMEAYRGGDEFVAAFDVPGVDPASIDVSVEGNTLTVKVERRTITGDDGVDVVVAERPSGAFSRQLFLGEALDTGHISAQYDAGVLTLRIPVQEPAKPRKIEISAGDAKQLAG
jgi:HSP20 family protein